MRQRIRVGGTAVVGWRASRDDVQAVLLQEKAPALLGPHRAGWTVARVLVDDDGRVIEPRERTVADLLDDVARTLREPGVTTMRKESGEFLLVVCSGQQAPLEAEMPAVTSTTPLDRPTWAAALRAIGAGRRLEEVLTAAAAAQETLRGAKRVAAHLRDARPRRVAAAAGLPAQLFDPEILGDPEPMREAVLALRADRQDPQISASVAGLPLRVIRRPQGVLLTAEPPDGTVLAPVGAALSQGRRRPVLVVWRQGAERGYQLCHRGTVENAHVWSADWRLLPLDPELDEDLRDFLRSWLEVAAGDADLLLARLRVTDVEAARVRALLRRAPGPDVLEQFCELLGLPSELAQVVEGADSAELPGSHIVTPTTMARTVLGVARAEPSAKDPWLVRVGHAKPWWYRAGNAVWVPVGSWWAMDLWSGGGPGRVAAVAVGLTAVVSLVVAVRPPRTRPAR